MSVNLDRDFDFIFRKIQLFLDQTGLEALKAIGVAVVSHPAT
jgi:hypothetical protein